MKYIKKFESTDSKEIVKLCQHICDFFYRTTDSSIKIEYQFDEYYFCYRFFRVMIDNKRKFLFTFSLIDYYFEDIDRFFQFTRANNRFLNDYEIEVVEFVEYVTNKYNKNQKMISFSDILNIVSDISIENFEIYQNQKKYNL